MENELKAAQARIAELEREARNDAVAYKAVLERQNELRAELAALREQEPAFMWHKGATEEESEVVDVDCACACCVPLYAAPVVSAEQQVVADGWQLVPVVPTMAMLDARRDDGDSFVIEADEYYFPDRNNARAFAAYVYQQMLAAAPAAPAADAGIVDMYRHLQKVTPYRFKKIQDASITDGGDVMYFHKDRFDAALLADMAANCAKESK